MSTKECRNHFVNTNYCFLLFSQIINVLSFSPRDLFLKFENVLSDLTKPFYLHILSESHKFILFRRPESDAPRELTGAMTPPQKNQKNHTHIPASVLCPLGSFDFSSIKYASPLTNFLHPRLYNMINILFKV